MKQMSIILALTIDLPKCVKTKLKEMLVVISFYRTVVIL